MANLSRSAQVLGYFLEDRGTLNHTRLLKLAYLADLSARRLLGRPITAFEYYFHHHGPFDSSLYGALGELKQAGLADERTEYYSDRKYEQRVTWTGGTRPAAFTAAEREILDYVTRTYAQMPLDQLLNEVVYETQPMKAARRGSRVPMAEQDNAERNEIGFDLEEVLAAEREALQGNYMTGQDFFDALRATIARDRPRQHH
jgi:hypothetical protein